MNQVKTEYIANWTQKQQGSINNSFCASQVMKKMGSFSGIKNYFKLMGGNRFLCYLMIQKSRFPPQGFFFPIISLLEKLIYRSNHQEEFLEKDVPKICSKFIGEHPCRSAISIKLFWKFIEITLRHGCTPVNMQQIFDVASEYATPFDGCF